MFPKMKTSTSGRTPRTPVALLEYRYDCPFKFTGKINKLTFDLGPAQYTEAERSSFPPLPTESPV
jgi:arylsulfatase